MVADDVHGFGKRGTLLGGLGVYTGTPVGLGDGMRADELVVSVGGAAGTAGAPVFLRSLAQYSTVFLQRFTSRLLYAPTALTYRAF